MMNLPLLHRASRETGDPRFRFIAQEHADTALRHLVRPDGSCNHIVELHLEYGTLESIPQGQGYAPGSSWSRGQSWALYGFALSYLYTQDARYLNAAKKIAHYFIANVQSTGFVPLLDFRAPPTPVKIDTSAGMIAASGLLQLATLLETGEAPLYKNAAMQILQNTEAQYCNWNPAYDSIVQRGAAQYHDKLDEYDVPLIYADYFFIEAVHKILYPDFQVW
jgi:unsaturated chondroitin disaccharide hydrolase